MKGRELKKGIATGSGATVAVFLICFCLLDIGRDGIAGFGNTAVGLALGGLLLPVIIYALRAALSCGKAPASRVMSCIVSIFLSAAAVCVAARASDEVGNFVCGVMELNCSHTIVVAAVLVVGAYMASLGAEAIKKFALVAFFFAAVSSIGVLTLAAVREGGLALRLGEIMKSDMLSRLSPEGISESLIVGVAPAIVAAAFVTMAQNRSKGLGLHSLGGALAAMAVLVLCFINVALVPGLEYASLSDYPYVTAAGSVSVGKLFLRPEGFVYLFYLWVSVSTVAACISVVCLAIKAEGRQKRLLPYLVGAAGLAAVCLDFIPFG